MQREPNMARLSLSLQISSIFDMEVGSAAAVISSIALQITCQVKTKSGQELDHDAYKQGARRYQIDAVDHARRIHAHVINELAPTRQQ